ncbi:MAG: hypothetical protein QG635_2058 [Bacteroidota bacterium]|nr:hypothetical protein [Bacteroidota bacterium]
MKKEQSKIIIIAIILFTCLNTLYSQEDEELIDAEKIVRVKNDTNEAPKEIKVPRFDIHTSFEYFLYFNIGTRALIMKNISLSMDFGLMLLYEKFTSYKFVVNYHIPFWHNMALSLSVKYDDLWKQYHQINGFGFGLSLSYIPIAEGRFHVNFRLGAAFVLLNEFDNSRALKYFLPYFNPEFGLSYSFSIKGDK